MPFNPNRAIVRAQARAFWQRFIDEVEFDDPQQPRPRHGGHNWVRIVLPSPARWLGVYHYKDRCGVYLLGEAEEVAERIRAKVDALGGGVEHVILNPVNWASEQLELLAAEVLPRVAPAERRPA